MGQPLPITNGFYMSPSLPLSAQECTNLIPRTIQAPALVQEALFGTPGISQLATVSTLTANNNRGSHVMGGIVYFVNGTSLYRLNSDFTTDTLGTVTGTGRVSMDDNGTQLMVLVPGGNGYIFVEAGDTFTQITDTDFTANGAPQQVKFIDSYFVCTTDSKKFIISASNDGLSYNALDFGSAESDPDDIVAPVIFNNQLFIGGSETLEGFSNRGGADFPFQRSGQFISKGISARFGVAKISTGFMWVGAGEDESPAIWQSSGGAPEKVSTTAIDNVLGALTASELDAVFTYTYSEDGDYFVCFTLPTTTFVINTINLKWHERKSRIVDPDDNAEMQRFRVNSLVRAYGKVIVFDNQDGRIGEMSMDIYSEYDSEIPRIISGQPFANSGDSFAVPSIELTMESGVGSLTENPVVRMSRSVNGRTFTRERSRSIGLIGKYGLRQIWHKCGMASRFEIFKFTITDKVKVVIMKLEADLIGNTK